MKLYKATGPGHVYGMDLATSADIIAAFNELPLPQRMSVYADGLAEASRRYKPVVRDGNPEYADWRPANLRYVADLWEREDAEKAREAAEVEELAKLIRSSAGRLGSWESIVESAREEYREQARAVLGAGYRKQADDDRP